MSETDLEAQVAALTGEEATLRDGLRSLEDDLQTQLRRGAHASGKDVDTIEREIRRIVLRLVEIEREKIELNVASSL